MELHWKGSAWNGGLVSFVLVRLLAGKRVEKKSRVRETLNLLTNAHTITIAMHQDFIIIRLSDYSVHFFLAGANSSK